jgi:hypothetical protein
MSDTSGPTSETPFAQWDQSSQSWKTSEDTSLLDLPMSSLTLPKSGGMRNGQLFQQPPLERPTNGNGYSSLPTPHAGLGERGRDGVTLNPKGQQDLQHAIAHLLPTPRAQNGETRNMNIWARPAGQPQNLENALALIGDSTNKPSNDGNTPSDDRPQTPQLWDQRADHD